MISPSGLSAESMVRIAINRPGMSNHRDDRPCRVRPR